MNAHDFEKLFDTLGEINNGLVIKDFVGFLNWDSSIGSVLLPYTGHHSPFCQMSKSNPLSYDRCVACSDVSRRLCERRRTAFTGTCYLGISEYTVPLIIGNECIGSLSIGSYCQDPAETERRILRMAHRFSLDAEALTAAFSHCSQEAPNENSKAIFLFFAQFFSSYFATFQKKSVGSQSSAARSDSALEKILCYIFQHYTDPDINVQEIACACDYSSSTVSHIFNEQMHTNVRTYINHLRIVLAKKELQSGNSVSMTAMICGFNDSNYFSTVFTSVVGIPPSLYGKERNRIALHPEQLLSQ